MKRKFIKKNDAISGVIEALLLVSLVAIILAIIQTVYIPEIMVDRENEHMDEVEKQFSNLKATMDIQSITEEDAPVISVVTLGSKELPYFVSVRSTGFMRIINNTMYNLTFKPNIGNLGLESNGDYRTVFNLSSIKYEAYNYYIPEEKYILEGGMFILEDSNGENVKITPDLEVIENESNYVRLQMRLPIFLPAEGKDESSAGDYGPCYIRTSHSSTQTYSSLTPDNISSIKIFTDYTESWNNSLSEILENEIQNNYLSINAVNSNPSNYVEIRSESKNLHFNLELYRIDIQIGPGVVKK
jgi:hypothetical protein